VGNAATGLIEAFPSEGRWVLESREIRLEIA
jgi:hypothetical protein